MQHESCLEIKRSRGEGIRQLLTVRTHLSGHLEETCCKMHRNEDTHTADGAFNRALKGSQVALISI